MVLKKCWAIFGLLLLPWCAWANQAVLTNIRAFHENNKTRVVLELSQPIPYKAFPLQHPARYVVDLKSAKSNLNPKQIHFDNNPMKDVRFGHPTPGIFRVVFDMENMTPSRVFALPSDENAPARIVIDFKVTQKKVKKPQPVQPAQPVLSLPKQTLRNVVVVIDPGHGGKDPGAIGVRNIKEKNVVLAISKDLYKLLQKEPGMTPAMTRDGDYFISLRGRLKKARDDKADIFIAIHADAYKNRQSHGVSIYALSPRGATNVLRLGGKSAAAATLLGDVLKGFIPVLIAKLLGVSGFSLGLVAIAAFLGHLFPLFFAFKGGKGVATFLGVLLALSLWLGLAFIITWLIMAFLFRYSSLSALVASILTPVFCLLLSNNGYLFPIIFMVIILFIRHHQNISDLLDGKEGKLFQEKS